jgi:calnexin
MATEPKAENKALTGCERRPAGVTLFQGKWTRPMIPNPAYKGPWAPRKIPNPAFFEDLHPSLFTPLGGIGFELWTMTDDILCKSGPVRKSPPAPGVVKLT